ncbi:glycoside hydrolase family 36 protein [Thermothelomyces heterothallicus CBS 202.75]|uniref:glycoside hydrolase family 36 protein n=1 Tax=Thermothelomyces heterothallicus CBS 202.75 TaxID=1149848 RepID=UPI003743496D
MSAFIVTYPPLGQVTQLQNSELTIHTVLEVPPGSPTENWQLALWYSNGDQEEWEEAALVPSIHDARPTELHESIGAAARLFFTTRVVVRSSLTFTIKFRQGTDGQEWKWVRSEQGSGDAVVIINQKPTREDDPEDLPDLIRDLNPELEWKRHMSQSPGTRLWTVEAPVHGAKEDESAFVEVPLGIPWGGRFLRWFALVRSWTPWLAPRHGKSEFGLDKDGLLCSFLSSHGKHLVMLGLGGINNVTALLRSGDAGRLILSLRNDNVKSTTGTVLVAVGDNLENAVAAVTYHARTLVTAANAPNSHGMASPTAEGDVGPQWYENWYDGLGYCTWNSLGQQLTEEKILKALDTLAENKVNISNLIIDDNWQDIDYRGDGQWQYGWNDFEAEPRAFPRGLEALVSDIRSKHKNIQHIAVWHALLGYWAGLAPSGPLAKRYETVQVSRDDTQKSHLPIGNAMTVVAPSDVQDFYEDFYRFLTSCGIDGVKTDAQYMLDTLTQPAARRTLISSYLDAWTSSTLGHFAGGPVVAGMALSPPTLFHPRLFRTSLPPIVCRTSDDFVPTSGGGDDDAHPWHVWTNAHNALLAQHLNALPDWDMFQTAHPRGGFHAAARCISGGPVCVTDPPGQHDQELLCQLAGATPRGRTVVFRPSTVGRTLDAYSSRAADGGGGVLKVGAYHGRAGTGTGVVAVFNVDPRGHRPVAELLPLARFPGVGTGAGEEGAGGRYVVRAHRSGKVTPPLRAGSPAALVTVSLEAKGWDVLSAYPLHAVQSGTRGEVLLANLGLVGKMTGCAAVLRTVFEARENGRMLVDATVKALGVLGVYISVLPELSINDDFMVTIRGQPIPPHTVSVSRQDERVLEVDIETAWTEMGLESGWANEVQVKVYFALEKK